MLGGLAGVFIMVAITSFLATLLELGSLVLGPPSTKKDMENWLKTSGDNKQLIDAYSNRSPLSSDDVVKSLSKQLCEIPIDASGTGLGC